MNKPELRSAVAAQTSVSRATANTVVAAVFSTTDEAAARNEIVAIASSRAPALKAGKKLPEAVNVEK